MICVYNKVLKLKIKISRIKNIGLENIDVKFVGKNFNESLNKTITFRQIIMNFIQPFNNLYNQRT